MIKTLETLIPGLFTKRQGWYFMQYQFIPTLPNNVGSKLENVVLFLKQMAEERGIHLEVIDKPLKQGYLFRWRPEVRHVQR